jgi:serine/threonine-protein kinase
MSFGLAPAFAEEPSVEVAGAAFAQWPTFGDIVPPEGTVLVLLSNGTQPQPASATIPDVVGQTEDQAKRTLGEASFQTQVVSGFNPAAKGAIFAQLPAASGTVAPGTPIVLAVSLGPLVDGRLVTVPDVTQMTALPAAAALVQAGLQAQQADVGGLSEPAGKVIGQLPPAGWSVPAGSIAIVSVATSK